MSNAPTAQHTSSWKPPAECPPAYLESEADEMTVGLAGRN
jgi:hypothetical protein